MEREEKRSKSSCRKRNDDDEKNKNILISYTNNNIPIFMVDLFLPLAAYQCNKRAHVNKSRLKEFHHMKIKFGEQTKRTGKRRRRSYDDDNKKKQTSD